MMERRNFIKALGASLVLFQTPLLAMSLEANQLTSTQPAKLVWVVLRGAMDSLGTVVPTFDTNLLKQRPKLAKGIKEQLLPLDNGYGFHPALANLHQWYKDKQLLPIVAVSSGYTERSHFDGQDYLESGLANIDHNSGWLARAISQKNVNAIALARSTPISLRKTPQANTWYPSRLKDADSDVYQALSSMYADDKLLLDRLNQGLALQGLTQQESNKSNGKFVDLSKTCAKLMIDPKSNVDCAMLELGGWDTHSNQNNRLAKQLEELDNGLHALKQGLGTQWQNTVIIVATEFGRTVKENGTLGTDHGTASAMFIAGEKVKGGQIAGQWPGLADEQLFEKRDLMPTSNTFSWIARTLNEHWKLTPQQLAHVFPSVPIASASVIKA